MSTEAQTHMIDGIHKAIDYARMEFDVTFADMLGSLEFVKAEILTEVKEVQADDDEEGLRA